MTSSVTQREYWNEIARRWSLLGPPLRPSAPDLAGYQRGIREFAVPRAAILGVTPELYGIAWPEGSSVVAIDHNRPMIEAVWPGPREVAICADWRSLPLKEGSRDLVLCDGGFSMLPYPDAARAAIGCVRRVLGSRGLALFRLYVPAGSRETADDVLDELMNGAIPSLNHLKLKLGMALQRSPSEGVELDKIWQTLSRAAPDFEELAAGIGWDLDHLLAINAYRDSRNRYYFPARDEVEHLFAESGFSLEWVSLPEYKLGERCPLACFRRAS